MTRRRALLAPLITAVAATAVFAVATAAGAATWQVAPQGGADALRAALAGAAAGDTVVVTGGVWAGPFRIATSLRLVGHERPVLDGGGRGTVVSIVAPDVTLEGFVVRGSGSSLDEESSGIAVEAPRARIVGNRLEDVLFGIYLRHAEDSLVADNVIVGKALDLPRRGDAVRVWYSHGVRLEGNDVESSRDVVLWYSERLEVRDNRVRGGRYGLHFMYCDGARIEGNELLDNSVGAFLMYSRRLRLTGNRIAGNHGPSGYGVGLKDMDDAIVAGNHLVGNRVGIFLDNTPREVDGTFLAEANLLAANDVGVQLMPSVRRGRFLTNSLVENLEQVAVSGGGGDPEGNLWRGNYWSDYAGFDGDGDGTGDLPHRLDRLFESLGDRRPALRFFLHSPASASLDLAAHAFPLVRPQPKLTDPEPSMHLAMPPIAAAGVAGIAAGDRGALVLAGSLLTAGALLLWLTPVLRRRMVTVAPGALPWAPTVAAGHDDTRTEEAQADAGTAPILAVRGLVKRYGDHVALGGLDLAIHPGESVALWGANGAGKTTALRALLGLVPYEGDVLVGGRHTWREGKAARRLLGFVPQEVTLQADLTGREVLELFSRLRGAPPADLARLVASVGLEEHVEKRIGALSGGLRQRLAVAAALVGDPPVLLLDEPTANLDAAARADLLALLHRVKAAGKTLVFSSHRPEEVLALADRVIHLHRGRMIADGPPQEVLGERPSELWLRVAAADLERAAALLQASEAPSRRLGGLLVVEVAGSGKSDTIVALRAAGIAVLDFDLVPTSRPSAEVA